MFVKLLAPFLFFILFQAYLREPRDFRRAEKAVFVVCAIVLAIALLNNLTGGWLAADPDNLWWIRKNSLTAPFMSPANFSFLMGVGAILALVNFFTKKRFRFLALYLIFSVGVFWAFTRISMGGLVIATSICVWMLSRSTAFKVSFPVLILVGFVVSFFAVGQLRERMFMDSSVTFTSLFENPERIQSSVYMSGRAFLWEAATKNFVDKNPLLGAGVGSVDRWLDSTIHSRLHSEYLRIVCDLGAVGLLLYLIAMVSFFRRMASIRRKAKDPLVKKYAVGAIAALSFYATTLATDNSLNYVTEFGMYVFLLMAFAFAAFAWERRARVTDFPNKALRPLISAPAVVVR